MKKFIKFILLLLLFASSGVMAEDTSVLIVKSSDNSFFNKTIEQLVKKSEYKINFQIETLGSIKQDDPVFLNSAVIITLGLAAANYPFKTDLNIPVIHSYITEFQYSQHQQQKNHHSVFLDQPLQRYLAFIKYLLAPQSIGIIRNKKHKISAKTVKKVTSSLDLTLDQRLFKTGDKPLNLVRDLLQTNDVLLSLPNPEVYNRQSLKGILLASYRQNKPVISYSPAHVKSGALASIYSSPENIGNQLAELMNKIVNDNFFEPDAYYYASEYEVNINDRVAKSLGLKLTPKEKIIRQLKESIKK